ncbi:hypothetical protein [Moorena sp. SIO2C4]|uniref:hypothetical protein n=1 Tax=Moorena sp. SIO2C4 TaxID=2607824 RepID=UPI0033903F5D
MRFSPDLKSLAASSEDGRVIIWSLEGKKPQIFKAHDKAVLSIMLVIMSGCSPHSFLRLFPFCA